VGISFCVVGGVDGVWACVNNGRNKRGNVSSDMILVLSFMMVRC